MLNVGQTISSYQLLAQIASGGQATVYRARHTVLQREVALKVLHAHLITDASFVQKFAQEAQLLAQLKHPSIVEVYNAGYDAASGAYFIEMELLPGSDLDALIAQQGWLAVDVVVSVAKQVASTLEYAHARGLIHRDIKPSNIILLPDGHVKVLDFGIAAIVAAGQKAKTRIGTVEYMAPEHFAGNADARSDIYSLGATLYHCLTGQVPPVVASQPPTPVRQLNPVVSPVLENVILKSLHVDAAKRQQTAREFIIEIERALRAPQVSVSAPATMQCPHCGATNRVGAKHCATCGRAMTVAPKTYAGALKVRMAGAPLQPPSGFEPQFYWSPDGKQLLVSYYNGSDTILVTGWTFYTTSHFECAIKRIKYKEPDLIAIQVQLESTPAWSPGGKEIAYTARADGKIWLFDLANGSNRQLTFGDGVHRDSLWSPDGQYLAYLSEFTSGNQWQVIRLDTPKVVTIEGWLCAGWSPSGRRFSCLDFENRQFVVFENGTRTMLDLSHEFIAKKEHRRAAMWVSDSQIAISRDWKMSNEEEFGQHEIYLFDVEKKTRQPQWLPARSFVVAKSFPARVAGGELLMVDPPNIVDGQIVGEATFRSYLVWTDATRSGFHRLPSTNTPSTGSGVFCVAEDWSPDANRILFTRGRESYHGQQWVYRGTEILVVNTDDTGLQKLADGFNPKWSPDGRYIAFLRSPQDQVYELWVMEVE